MSALAKNIGLPLMLPNRPEYWQGMSWIKIIILFCAASIFPIVYLAQTGQQIARAPVVDPTPQIGTSGMMPPQDRTLRTKASVSLKSREAEAKSLIDSLLDGTCKDREYTVRLLGAMPCPKRDSMIVADVKKTHRLSELEVAIALDHAQSPDAIQCLVALSRTGRSSSARLAAIISWGRRMGLPGQ